MKTIFFLFSLFFFSAVCAQKGNELLVYSLKGNVTVIENNSETRLKIGKVLKPGSVVKTQREAKLTMVCKEGKPISVTEEGSYPVVTWKDSCLTTQNSMSSKFFQYVWDQLYVRSDEYKREHPGGLGSVENIGAPVRGQEDLEILFSADLDTINYSSGNFPLSWSVNLDYPGKYYFVLFPAKGGKPLYKDSISGTTLPLDKLKKYMKPGTSYGWSLATQKTSVENGGIIKYVTLTTVARHIVKLQKAVNVPEDDGAQYFRIAYLLQKSHYPADAFIYYQKAVKASPEVDFYREKLEEFKMNFQVN
ncbi:MAG: hypothetical protein H7Y01_03170 [Ferruginibacter sp.]|nr:hypothetical protein [Chitinophagaceae bacterium]